MGKDSSRQKVTFNDFIAIYFYKDLVKLYLLLFICNCIYFIRLN